MEIPTVCIYVDSIKCIDFYIHLLVIKLRFTLNFKMISLLQQNKAIGNILKFF